MACFAGDKWKAAVIADSIHIPVPRMTADYIKNQFIIQYQERDTQTFLSVHIVQI